MWFVLELVNHFEVKVTDLKGLLKVDEACACFNWQDFWHSRGRQPQFLRWDCNRQCLL